MDFKALIQELDFILRKLESLSAQISDDNTPLNTDFLNEFESLILRFEQQCQSMDIDYIKDKLCSSQRNIEDSFRLIRGEALDAEDRTLRYKKHQEAFNNGYTNKNNRTFPKYSRIESAKDPYSDCTERRNLPPSEYAIYTERLPQKKNRVNALDPVRAKLKQRKIYRFYSYINNILDKAWEKAFGLFGLENVENAKDFYLDNVDRFIRSDHMTKANYLRAIRNLTKVEKKISAFASYNRITLPIRFLPQFLFRVMKSCLTLSPVRIGNTIRKTLHDFKTILNIPSYETTALAELTKLKDNLQRYYDYKNKVASAAALDGLKNKFSRIKSLQADIVAHFKANIYRNSPNRFTKAAVSRFFHNKMRTLFDADSPLLSRKLLDTLDSKQAFKNLKSNLPFSRKISNFILGLKFEPVVLWLDSQFAFKTVQSTLKTLGITDTARFLGKISINLSKKAYDVANKINNAISPTKEQRIRQSKIATVQNTLNRSFAEVVQDGPKHLKELEQDIRSNSQRSKSHKAKRNPGTTLNSGLAFAETALPAKWQQKIDAMPGFFYDDRGPSVISRVYTAIKPKVKGAVKAVAHELTPPTNPKVYATGPLSYMVNNGQTDMALMILVSAAMPETMRDHGRTVENGLPFVTAPIEHYIIGTTGGAGFCATTSQIVRYYVLPRVTSWSHTVGKVTTNTVKTTGATLKTTGMAMATVPAAETAAVISGVAVMGLTMYAVANIPIEETTTPDQIRTLLNAGHITLDQASTATALDGDNKPYVVFSVDTNKLDDALNKLLPTDSHLAFHITDNGKISRLKTDLPIQAPKTWNTEKDVELNFTSPATLEKLKEAIVPQNLTAPAPKKQKETVVPQNHLVLGR